MVMELSLQYYICCYIIASVYNIASYITLYIAYHVGVSKGYMAIL